MMGLQDLGILLVGMPEAHQWVDPCVIVGHGLERECILGVGAAAHACVACAGTAPETEHLVECAVVEWGDARPAWVSCVTFEVHEMFLRRAFSGTT